MADYPAESGTWEESIAELKPKEARKRVAMALRCNYAAHGNSLPLIHLDNILNGRWFAVPKEFGGER